MGAEEYELLVSTLDKLPILNEKLSLEREKYHKANQRIFSQKEQIDELENELKTRDSKIHEIDSRIEEINQQVEKLDQEIADLEDNIKIEKKKVKPYSQRLGEASERLARKKDSFWSNENYRYVISIVLGWFLALLSIGELGVPDFLACGFMLVWPIILLGSTFDESYAVKLATRKKDEVKSEWKKASRALDGFNMKRGKKNQAKTILVREENKLKRNKAHLRGLENDLMMMNKKLFELAASAAVLLKEVEFLEKEIHDGQNAIAPLIPYSYLLSDDGFL